MEMTTKHASTRPTRKDENEEGLDLDVQPLAAGMMGVSSRPCVFKTIVGSGLVVAMSLKMDKGGGLLHIPARPENLDVVDQTSEAWLHRFMRRFASSGLDVSDAQAMLIGGANLLQRFPRHQRLGPEHGFVNGVESFLMDRRIQTVRRSVGGSEVREVTFEVGTNEIDIRPLTSTPSESACEPTHPDRHGGARTTVVNMGCLHVDRSPNRLIAILGSCVGIALFDPATSIGGLAHVMMPQCPHGNAERSKYADTAVSELLERMEDSGARRKGIIAKILGGATVVFADEASPFNDIGSRNVEQARESLRRTEIRICSEDVGGKLGRRIRIDLTNFHVMIKTLTGCAR